MRVQDLPTRERFNIPHQWAESRVKYSISHFNQLLWDVQCMLFEKAIKGNNTILYNIWHAMKHILVCFSMF